MNERGRGKGELVFVGLGLDDERGVTLKGLEEARSADSVFAEFYTSTLREGALERLSEMIGRGIKTLSREEVEDGKALLDACADRKVALLVAGDPMTATTHIDLRLRAAKESTETSVVHAPSVLTAVPGLLGLQHYRLGRVTTVPFSREGYAPVSPLEIILDNLERGLHSVVLLDIDSEAGRFMSANEGMEALLEMADRLPGEAGLTERTLVCVVARAGAPDCLLAAGRIADMKARDFGPPMHTIVLPGKLHFMEEEALRAFAGLGT